MPDYVAAAIQDEVRRRRAAPPPPVNLGTIAQRTLPAVAAPNWRPAAGEIVPGGRGIRQGTGEVFTGEQPVGEVIIGPRPAPVVPQGPAGGGEDQTEALLNSAISARQARFAEIADQRANLAANRAELIQRYQTLPVGRGGRETIAHKAITDELHGLDLAERQLAAQERFAHQEAQSQETAAFRKQTNARLLQQAQLHTDTSNQATAALNRLSEIESTMQHGSPEFRAAMRQLRNDYPLSIKNPYAAAELRRASEFHDVEEQRVRNQLGSQLVKAGLTPQAFASIDPNTIRATNAPVGATKDVIKKNQANEGQTIAFDLGGSTITMDRAHFENLSRVFRPQPEAKIAAVAPETTAPTEAPATPAAPVGAAPPRASSAETVQAAINRGAIVLSPEQAARRAAATQNVPIAPPTAAPPTAAAVPTPGGFPAGGPAAVQPVAAAPAPTVKMVAPSGATRDVPADQVDHYRQLGATIAQ